MKINSYFNFRVYCDQNYNRTKELVAAFIEDLSWVVDGSDGYASFKKEIHGFSERGDSSVLFVSPARMLAEDYNAVVFRVENNDEKTLAEYNRLPINVRQRFQYYPTTIFIDGNKFLRQLIESTAAKLVDLLKQNQSNAYILAFNGQYLHIINSAYVDDADKSEYIHNLIAHFIAVADLPELNFDLLPSSFKWIAPSMTTDALKTLKTAELLRSSGLELLDYSGVIIEYCKTVEIQLDHILMKPIRDRWSNTNRPSSIPSALKKLYDYVFSEEAKPLELGTTAALMQLSFSHPNFSNDALALTLKETFSELPFNQESQWLIEDILFLTRNFRNPAAHKSILNKEDMEACRNYVVGTEEKDGLLAILLRTKF